MIEKDKADGVSIERETSSTMRHTSGYPVEMMTSFPMTNSVLCPTPTSAIFLVLCHPSQAFTIEVVSRTKCNAQPI
jgi:hypothetical protein